MPMAMAAAASPRSLTPAFVTRSFEEEMAEMRQTLQGLEEDLVLFQDVRQLKAALRDIAFGPTEEDIALLQAMLEDSVPRRRRKTRR